MRRIAVASALFFGVTAVGVRPAAANAQVSGTITISAASSLRESFVAIGKAFRAANPKVRVRFNFGSSSTLVSQIIAGAPADVVAVADLATMDKLVSQGSITGTPKVFARNSMVIAVKPGNPHKISSVADLARVGVVALCVVTAPCGGYAKSVLSRSGVSLAESSITRGIDVAATLAQVTTGDAQAAIVYSTDVLAAGSAVSGVTIPRASNVTAMYPIASIKGSANAEAARAFVEFVTSDKGWSILKSYGFLRP